MNLSDLREVFIFTVLLLILTIGLANYMAQVYQETNSYLTLPFRWLEKLCYKVASIDSKTEMSSSTYIKAMLAFNFVGFSFLFFLMLTQYYLPLNPENFHGSSLHLAFNVAASFVTNTDWQSYVPESSLSYLTQMLGLTVQNFLASATGLAVLVAFMRGITRKSMDTIGNFWEDLVRSIVYILLPLAIILACIYLSLGVVQSFSPYVQITTLEGASQTIPLGPVASQIAIKQLGTSGGGFFSANSAHPFENPSALANFIGTLSLIIIPSASIYFYGITKGMKKKGWLIYSVIFFLFAIGFVISLFGEYLYGINFGASPVLEGKETRFGLEPTILWSTTTTSTANGSVNAMTSSLSPMAGGIALFNMMLGEHIFGGVGVGMCSMIMFILLTIFLSGLMVGRTPEYFGKKIEVREMQWITAAILIPPALILVGSTITTFLPAASAYFENQGPHGLSSILYAFTSTTTNNGSAFAGFNGNTPYYNIIFGVIMLTARFAILIPSLMIAGLLVKKKVSPASIGTFSTNSLLFSLLFLSVILIVGALTFFPSIALGPIAEQLLMMENRFF